MNVPVELAGAGTRRETVSGGSVRSGVHGPLVRPVLIPVSRAVQRSGRAKSARGNPAPGWGASQSTSTRRFQAMDILGKIEEPGWHLQDVGYVFVEMGELSRSKVMPSGAVSRTQGYVEGIYLFRRR